MMQVVCEVCGYNVSVPGQRCQPDDLLMAGGRRAVVPVFEMDVVEPWTKGHWRGALEGCVGTWHRTRLTGIAEYGIHAPFRPLPTLPR